MIMINDESTSGTFICSGTICETTYTEGSVQIKSSSFPNLSIWTNYTEPSLTETAKSIIACLHSQPYVTAQIFNFSQIGALSAKLWPVKVLKVSGLRSRVRSLRGSYARLQRKPNLIDRTEHHSRIYCA